MSLYTLRDGRSIRLSLVEVVGEIVPVLSPPRLSETPTVEGFGFKVMLAHREVWVEHRIREAAESERQIILNTIAILDQ